MSSSKHACRAKRFVARRYAISRSSPYRPRASTTSRRMFAFFQRRLKKRRGLHPDRVVAVRSIRRPHVASKWRWRLAFVDQRALRLVETPVSSAARLILAPSLGGALIDTLTGGDFLNAPRDIALPVEMYDVSTEILLRLLMLDVLSC